MGSGKYSTKFKSLVANSATELWVHKNVRNDVVFCVAEDDDHQFEIKELVQKYHYVLVDSALV